MDKSYKKLKELNIPDGWIKDIFGRRTYLEKAGLTYYPLENEWEINFECSKCGECCKEVQYTMGENVMIETNTITVIPEEIHRISDFLKISPVTFVNKFCQIGNVQGKKVAVWEANPCPFLSESQCTIHIARPDTCKLHPASALLFSIVKSPVCNGFDRGRLLDLDRIRFLLVERINKLDKNLRDAPTKEKEFKKSLLKRA